MIKKYYLLFLSFLINNSFLIRTTYCQTEEDSKFSSIFALGYSTEKILLSDILIEHNYYYGGLSFALWDREPGQCDEETECYYNCSNLDPEDIIRYTHNRYSTFAIMMKAGLKYSDYIFLISLGANFNL